MTPAKVSRNFPEHKITCVASGIRADSQISKQETIDPVAVELFIEVWSDRALFPFPFLIWSHHSISTGLLFRNGAAFLSHLHSVFQTDHSVAFCNRPGFERPGEPNIPWKPQSLRSDSSPVPDKTVTWLQNEVPFPKKQRDDVSY